MGKLVFISLGIHDEQDMSLRALKSAMSCDVLYAEFYTTKLDTNMKRLTNLAGRRVVELSRENLEEKCDVILGEAETKIVGLMIGGDCFTATTHISLLLEAKKRGIETKVVHGSSIYTAITETGLFIYRFGKTVTIPISSDIYKPTSPYETIKENNNRGLHTLLLLDIDVEKDRYLTVNEGLEILLEIENLQKERVISGETLAVGLARIGSERQRIKADSVKKLQKYDFGEPPHTLIIPGKLHFLEAEALIVLAKAPTQIRTEK
jgi:diphthine synthase